MENIKRTKGVSWKRIYKFKKENLWEGKQHKYSELAYELVKKGKVLDLGCGEGHDAFYFLKNKYEVTAIDISKEEINNLLTETKKQKLKVKALVKDINKYKLTGKYDIIVSYGVLQFLGKNYLDFVGQLKKHTNKNGVHSYYIFANEGDFYDIANKVFWFPSREELKMLYSDYRIVKFQKKKVKLLIKGDKGEDLFNIMYKVLLQNK